MSDKPIKLTIGGPVQVGNGTYLSRPADKELFDACKTGKLSYVLACRQIGKSSLMFETANKLRQVGIKTIIIDLNNIGQNVDINTWYFSLGGE